MHFYARGIGRMEHECVQNHYPPEWCWGGINGGSRPPLAVENISDGLFPPLHFSLRPVNTRARTHASTYPPADLRRRRISLLEARNSPLFSQALLTPPCVFYRGNSRGVSSRWKLVSRRHFEGKIVTIGSMYRRWLITVPYLLDWKCRFCFTRVG